LQHKANLNKEERKMTQATRFEKIFEHLNHLIDEGIMNDEIRNLLKDACRLMLMAKKRHDQTVGVFMNSK